MEQDNLTSERVKASVETIIKSNMLIYGLIRSQPGLQKVIDEIPNIIYELSITPNGKAILERVGLYDFFRGK